MNFWQRKLLAFLHDREWVTKVQPSRGELALSVMGIGRKYGKPGESWVKELIAERERDDKECDHAEEAE